MIPHTYLEHSLSVLRTRLKTPRAVSFGSYPRDPIPFITLSRETAAGASTVGPLLVTLLNQEIETDAQGWVLLDKDLLTRALLENQLPAQLAEYLPEDRISETQAAIGELVGLHPSLWQLEQKVAATILQLAHVGHVIFVGRGANHITRGLPAGLHVRLVASLPVRMGRLAAAESCAPDDAFRRIERQDLARRRFVRSHFDADLADPHLYDLVLNTDRLTPTAAARTIVYALHEHAKRLTAEAATSCAPAAGR